uniref:SET104 n=1 Tax=Arundo donax TaxID=35708 RepID=A0A0A9FKY6_ARUDO
MGSLRHRCRICSNRRHFRMQGDRHSPHQGSWHSQCECISLTAAPLHRLPRSCRRSAPHPIRKISRPGRPPRACPHRRRWAPRRRRHA